MTEQEFIASMRVLFRTWRGIEGTDQILADDILSDVVFVIGEQCFDVNSESPAGRALLAECKGERPREDEPPPALKLEMERDLKGAVAMGKVWGEVFDGLFSPKRS